MVTLKGESRVIPRNHLDLKRTLPHGGILAVPASFRTAAGTEALWVYVIFFFLKSEVQIDFGKL